MFPSPRSTGATIARLRERQRCSSGSGTLVEDGGTGSEVALVARIFEGEPAEARLSELGVEGTKPLVEAVLYGAAAARNTTDRHPTSYRGIRMWAEATEYLRFVLPEPWEPLTDGGVDLVVNRERGIAISVTKGDAATASRTMPPQVHYDRGEAVQRLVNGSFDTLFARGRRPEWEVWFLLHFLQPESCAAELSRPRAIDADGSVTGWAERVLLPTEDGGIGVRTPADAPRRPVPEVEVPIARRAV
jgi:hypothetical protein